MSFPARPRKGRKRFRYSAGSHGRVSSRRRGGTARGGSGGALAIDCLVGRRDRDSRRAPAPPSAPKCWAKGIPASMRFPSSSSSSLLPSSSSIFALTFIGAPLENKEDTRALLSSKEACRFRERRPPGVFLAPANIPQKRNIVCA